MLFQTLDNFDQNVFADFVGALEAVDTGPAARGRFGEQSEADWRTE